MYYGRIAYNKTPTELYLTNLYILDYRNLAEADIALAPKVNCFVGLNGMGKTNILDCVYMLSFTKSSLTSHDTDCIRHDAPAAMLRGTYMPDPADADNQTAGTTDSAEDRQIVISCTLRQGAKKQFRRQQKVYQRNIDHIGLIPLVMVSPADQQLISEGSDERRRFMDSVISQYDRIYLEHLTAYQQLLKQRNAMLKQFDQQQPTEADNALFDILEQQLADHSQYIHLQRRQFVESFLPYFHQIYQQISDDKEHTGLSYLTQLDNRDLLTALAQHRQRDLILGWTTQGVHKDDLEMTLNGYPLRQTGSQGQQKTFLLSLKLAEALLLADKHSRNELSNTQSQNRKPILLLDDIFDRLDSERVQRIISIVSSNRFGQIFITDTDRQHISQLLQLSPADKKLFEVTNGQVREILQ